jgi:hypothetical protein
MTTCIKRYGMMTILFMIMLADGIEGFTQKNPQLGFYTSVQPGFAFIKETEKNSQETYSYNRGAFALDLQLGISVSTKLNLHGTLVLSFGEPLFGDFSTSNTSVDLMGGGVTYLLTERLSLSANLGASKYPQNEYYSNYKNGMAYQFKVAYEFPVGTAWHIGSAFEYGGYSTSFSNDYSDYQVDVSRLGFRVTFSHYGKSNE